MKKNIFIVGPASVGKSSVGRLLANKLNYDFVDIDLIFCDRIAIISDYINKHGYTDYCEANSKLVDLLLVEFPSRTVFATPSGFLVHEKSPELVAKHLKLVSKNALSILLLPSLDPSESVKLIVSRQLARHPGADPATEKDRYLKRHRKYMNYGDIKIIGSYSPKETLEKVIIKLART